MKKLKPGAVNAIFMLCLLIGALVAGIGATMEITWLAPIGIALMMGGLLIQMTFYRCPHCKSYLGRSGGDFCPYCGKKVKE